MSDYDVIIVGAGNAAMAAAVSAREKGAERVVVLEKAPEHLRGGNTHFSGGLLRFAFDCQEDLRPLAPDTERRVANFFEDVRAYTRAQFRADLFRVTNGNTDLDLATTLINSSYDTALWMVRQGIVMEPALSLSRIRHGNRVRWSPGAVLRARQGGAGLTRMWFEIIKKRNIEVRYETSAVSLLTDRFRRVIGVNVHTRNGLERLTSKAVVLACGGFEANPTWRAAYLGPKWAKAKVRGSRFNTGEGLRMAFSLDARRYGQFSGCHSTPIDAAAPGFGDFKRTDTTNRLSYPFGVMLNKRGQRFVDEGEDFQFYTYARMGGVILDQIDGVAYQIFDADSESLLEPRYRTSKPIIAESLESLIRQLPLDGAMAHHTLQIYNSAIREGQFDPTRLDGLAAKGLTPAKSNWARPLKRPPFYAYATTGGITFTYGGLQINERANVIAGHGTPIEELFACGEIVGGLFHNNYLGGAGLMAGAVFGRIAGGVAAMKAAKSGSLVTSRALSPVRSEYIRSNV